MKKSIKNVAYATTGLSLLVLNNINVFAISVDGTKTNTTADNAVTGNFIETLDSIFGYLVGLLYFVAIVFAVYGGFQILTAGGDEEKVKKGKTTLINAVIGLFVIFLSSTIINWVINIGENNAIVQ